MELIYVTVQWTVNIILTLLGAKSLPCTESVGSVSRFCLTRKLQISPSLPSALPSLSLSPVLSISEKFMTHLYPEKSRGKKLFTDILFLQIIHTTARCNLRIGPSCLVVNLLLHILLWKNFYRNLQDEGKRGQKNPSKIKTLFFSLCMHVWFPKHEDFWLYMLFMS